MDAQQSWMNDRPQKNRAKIEIEPKPAVEISTFATAVSRANEFGYASVSFIIRGVVALLCTKNWKTVLALHPFLLFIVLCESKSRLDQISCANKTPL